MESKDYRKEFKREQCACQGPHHCSWSIQQEIFRSLVEKFTRPFTRRGWLCYSSDSQYIDVICHKTPYKTCQLSGNRHFCNVALCLHTQSLLGCSSTAVPSKMLTSVLPFVDRNNLRFRWVKSEHARFRLSKWNRVRVYSRWIFL